jgi:hypothetical protein
MNNLLTMRFTKVFATNVSLDLIYDDDVIKRRFNKKRDIDKNEISEKEIK